MSEIPEILNMLRIPARTTFVQTAELLGFSPEELIVLIRHHHLSPLDSSSADYYNLHFSSAEIQSLANDRQWLAQANQIVSPQRIPPSNPPFSSSLDFPNKNSVSGVKPSGDNKNELNQSAPIVNSSRVALKLKEAAQCMGISEKTIRRLIDRGLLRRCLALRHIVIERKEIDRFLRENTSLA
jgi:excisionase family DNA binding protein